MIPLLLAAFLAACPALADRAAPPKIEPIALEGRRYSTRFETDSRGMTASLVAEREGDPSPVWKTALWTRAWAVVEPDVQEIHPKSLAMKGKELVVEDERGNVYRVRASDGKLVDPKGTRIYPPLALDPPSAETVEFQSGSLRLGGILYRPSDPGRYPAILFSHGSAPGDLSAEAAHALGPIFAREGWVFFMPWRRGQGASAKAGPYIGTEIEKARKKGVGDAELVRLLSTDHLEDARAALAWLRSRPDVKPAGVAIAGNSFGGIVTLLLAAREESCGAIAAAGGAQSWSQAPKLRALLLEAAPAAKAPVFFIQAENDFDLAPSRRLAEAMRKAGKPHEVRIYPKSGKSAKDGHAFIYREPARWIGDALRFLRPLCL